MKISSSNRRMSILHRRLIDKMVSSATTCTRSGTNPSQTAFNPLLVYVKFNIAASLGRVVLRAKSTGGYMLQIEIPPHHEWLGQEQRRYRLVAQPSKQKDKEATRPIEA
jgi:hypothetical protein